MTGWIFAALHLIALGLGLGAIAMRAVTLRTPLDTQALRRVFFVDAVWGLAALLWISTGLVRAFTGLEKGSTYYLGNDAFLLKMGMLATILLLEVWPMVTLIGWRIRSARGKVVDTSRARTFATISTIQVALVVAMVFAATAIARGLGL